MTPPTLPSVCSVYSLYSLYSVYSAVTSLEKAMITSPSNQHIALLRSLHTLKGRDSSGLFLVEGPHLLEAALAAHVVPRLLVYDSEGLARTPAGRQLLGRIDEVRARGAEALEASPI